MTHDDRRVLIAGGGPVGLFCALLLGRHGLPVRLFDENAQPQPDPRAATTHPATLELLGAAGLAEEVARVGLVAPIFQFWDRPTGRKVAEFDHALLENDTPYPLVVQCEQFKTARLILERLAALPNVEVLFGHEVVEVSQDGRSVTAGVRGPDGLRSHTGAYLIGADGGRSTARKQCGIAFEGFTWPERFIVLTTPFDFAASRGYCYRSYFADPDEWCNCFKVSAGGPPGLWRTVYPTDPALSDEELMSDEAVQVRLQRFFPAAEPYEIVHRNLYVTHQRVASRFRAGRVVLAGDAAHVNNPIGGMGLNGGLQDAANASERIAKILLDGAPDRLLDLYDLQRRTVATEFVQEQTIANKKRLEARDPHARRRNLDDLRAIAADPKRAREFLLRSSMIASQRRVAAMTLEDA
ncbi:MAG TPA: FAD-dependent monooxygenase [Xanthobacteraceae bacterium]|nr:FAD-dependent monooxygenase [Xanthobacteraceae bacterium]